MKNSASRYRSEIFARLWAILLLAVFLNAMLIESLHHHEAEKTTYSKQGFKQKDVQQLNTAKLKCKLCEVVKHRSHFFELPIPTLSLLPLNEVGSNRAVYLMGHPIAYILSCANKGPPSLVA
ncbi:hypothetical protein ACS5PU_20160 [Pedobacter sp. GSP4]|uniref:hypothetical protein n=1 Tax=Pedobacter sp. GSP4 TaxID=3453716 RepID=UPI003EEA2418